VLGEKGVDQHRRQPVHQLRLDLVREESRRLTDQSDSAQCRDDELFRTGTEEGLPTDFGHLRGNQHWTHGLDNDPIVVVFETENGR